MRKPIILIGGTAGTGKTTIANALCSQLGIDHRIGTGFIREIVKSVITNNNSRLFSFTFRAEDPIKNLKLQAEQLLVPIKKCIKRAKDEGTSLVIEGNHLIPEIYYDVAVDLFIILFNNENLEERLAGNTHYKRKMSENDIKNIKKISEYLIDTAREFKIKTINSAQPIHIIVNNIKELIGLRNG